MQFAELIYPLVDKTKICHISPHLTDSPPNHLQDNLSEQLQLGENYNLNIETNFIELNNFQ